MPRYHDSHYTRHDRHYETRRLDCRHYEGYALQARNTHATFTTTITGLLSRRDTLRHYATPFHYAYHIYATCALLRHAIDVTLRRYMLAPLRDERWQT